MLRTAFSFILFVLGTGSVFSQQPSLKPTSSTCSFSEVFKADGWTVPGLRNAKVKMRATFSNIPGVTVTILEPFEAESTITEVYCSRDHEGRLELEDRPIGILELSAYEYKGRVYAYGLSYEIQAMEDGARVRLAAASGCLFYDLDGSGRFKLRKWAAWPFIPDPPPQAARAAGPNPAATEPTFMEKKQVPQ